MSFNADSTGIDPEATNYRLLPEDQWFAFKIIEAVEGQSKSGFPLVKVVAEAIDSSEFAGIRVFHYVTFMPKGNPGAGIWVHWLKSIGQPWEGKLKINPLAWINLRFKGKTKIEEYEGKRNSKFKAIDAYGVKPLEEPTGTVNNDDDSIPF